MIFEVTVPKFAEGATVIRLKKWLCQEGQKVAVGETLAEASTDKIAIYIEAPVDGLVADIMVVEGDKVHIGQVIARIDGNSGGAGK